MKHFVRRLPIVLIVLLALTLAAPAFAQGSDPLCTGLSDADCQLLLGTTTAMAGLTSFTTPAWAVDLNVSDGTQQYVFNANGSGGFQLAPDASELLIHLVINQASIASPDLTQSLAAEIILTQNMGYVNYNGEWYGGEITEEDLAEMGLGDLDSMLGGETTGGLGDAASLAGIDLTGVITTTRGADEQVGGQPVAAFTTNINIAQLVTALLSSPTVGEALGMGGAELGMEEMTPEDIQMMGAFLTPLLSQTTLSVGQWVGTNDQMLRKIALDMVLNLDLTMFDPEASAIAGNISFMAELDGFNQPLAVTFPQSYRPIEELEAQLEALDMGF
ncbi:MAG: hypothetical protein KBH93_00705 [Anaerolineae bacterium]|nr:hypothetical protein [Anaerolineae bacterium]